MTLEGQTTTDVLYNKRVPVTLKYPYYSHSHSHSHSHASPALQAVGASPATIATVSISGTSNPSATTTTSATSPLSPVRRSQFDYAPSSQTTSSSSPSTTLSEKKNPGITVKIALSIKGPGRIKVLEITLTDETDPFFLCQLDIGEEDFHTVKNEQNLLVDFQQFPHKFIELLEECVKCRNQENPKYVTFYPVFKSLL